MDEWDVPYHWSEAEADLFQPFVEARGMLGSDDYAQILFHEAYFDRDLDHPDRDRIHDALVEHLDRYYGITFDDLFDWDAYDDWYNEQ